MIQCRLCGIQGHEAVGVVLTRVNEKGVEGIWECRPSCGAKLSTEEGVLAAIDGKYECQHLQVVYEPNRRCAECGISMPSPSQQAKIPESLLYSANQLREEVLYEYLGQAPEPGLFEFLDWLVSRKEQETKE